MSYDWVATVLRESFVVDAAPFDETWFEYIDPPEDDRVEDDFEFLRRTVLFQIADLRRMVGNQLEDPHRGLGVRSPTGNSWYNFQPAGHLECGMQGFIDDLAVGKLQEYERNCN